MLEKASVAVLVNNCVAETSACLGEHGLSLLLEFMEDHKPGKILMDLGQRVSTLVHNLAVMHITLQDLDALVLSHGHYDHGGDLRQFLVYLGYVPPRIVAHPSAWIERYSQGQQLFPIGMAMSRQEAELVLGSALLDSDQPIPLSPSIIVSGPIARDYGPSSLGRFVKQTGLSLEPDLVSDDQSLILDLGPEQGIFVITGCCHSGLLNTLENCLQISGRQRIKGVMGGLHLKGMGREVLNQIADYLNKTGCQVFAPLHCTGMAESAYMAAKLGDMMRFLGAGQCLDIL